MTMATALLSLENDLFCIFIGHACIVIVKMMLMSFTTSYFRRRNQAFINPEDVKARGVKKGVVKDDPDVERVRRIHHNDLENVIPFVLLGLIYTATGPDPFYAAIHFRIFTISRLLHTAVYLFAVPQPARGNFFLLGFLVNISMCFQIIRNASF